MIHKSQTKITSVIIKILTEKISRFGDFGAVLPTHLLDDSKLCRIILDRSFVFNQPLSIDDIHTLEYPPTKMDYTQFIGMVMRQLNSERGRFWCIGETNKKGINQLKINSNIDISSLPTSSDSVLVSYLLKSDQIRETTTWAIYNGEDSIRTFAFEGAETNLERSLAHLNHSIKGKSTDAFTSWKELCNRCLLRSQLSEMCNQARFIVAPDGPHFSMAAFHSKQIKCDTITDHICDLARENDLECEIIENLSDEYKTF